MPETLLATIEIPFATKSLNDTIRMHWAQLRREKQIYHEAIMAVLNRDDAGLIERPLLKRRIKITRYGARALDYNNFVGGCKELIDAVKAAGLIRDDSPTWLIEDYEQQKCKRTEQRTRVEIFELS